MTAKIVFLTVLFGGHLALGVL